ncbi:cadherin-17 [Heptranchias perlo]|uniref:cadherin-17 n=1 Tax=Heptranchias perlo TaxID=212740 RepID=UPI00355AAEC0
MRTSSHHHLDKLLSLFVALILTTGINGNFPKGPLQSMDLNVAEDTAVPLLIFQFIATNDAVKSFKISGETEGRFHVEDNGWLYSNMSLDREQKAVYKLQIEGLNEKQETVEGPVTVTILVRDTNDNQPIFTKKTYDGVVRQNARPGKAFMYVEATDLDDPATPNAKIMYRISQQIPTTDKIMLFQINNETGAISTTEEGYNLLDPAKQDSYELIVIAKDSAALPLSTNTIVLITVKENLWKSPGIIEISENSTDPHPKIITQVQWNEPGAKYELKPKDKMFYPTFPFVIDDNGNINVTEPLDREKISEYVLLAYALDENRELLENPLEIVVIVTDVNDNYPVCEHVVTMIEVQENENIGSYIGTVSATDMDKEDTGSSLLNYKILDQEPKIPEDNMFTIGDFNGKIQRFKGHLQKKNAPEYILKVLVSDQLGREGGLSTECIVNISVIDINDQIPIFEKLEYGPITFPENTSLDTVLIEIQATDDDEALTGSSEILYHVVEGDVNGTFKIITEESTNKGMVQLAKPLNFEECPVYNLKISATNPEPLVTGVEYNASSFTFLIVNVTNDDEPPQFLASSYRQWIFENASKGAILLKVEAKDPEGAGVRYELTSDPRNWFRIDPKTGEIFVNDELDMEKERHYNIRAIAMEEDNPKKRSKVDISIYLKDVNDNPPKLAKDSSSFFVCLPAQEETKITIHAVDDDVEIGPPFKFSIREDPGAKWKIEPINGTHASVIMKLGAHNEETDYKTYVTISDSGSPPLQGTDFITVKVCKCTDSKECFIEVDRESTSSKVGLAVGILLGTFAVIGLILAVVFLNMKRKKNGKGPKTDPKAARTEKETIALTSA